MSSRNSCHLYLAFVLPNTKKSYVYYTRLFYDLSHVYTHILNPSPKYLALTSPLHPGIGEKQTSGCVSSERWTKPQLGTELCICLWSPWTYLSTPPHTPHDSPNHRHDDLLHGKHRCLGDLLLSNCHRPQQQAGHMGGSHTNCSHTATPPSPPPPIVNRIPQLRGKNSKFKWGLNITPCPSHAHLTVQMQSLFPFW